MCVNYAIHGSLPCSWLHVKLKVRLSVMSTIPLICVGIGVALLYKEEIKDYIVKQLQVEIVHSKSGLNQDHQPYEIVKGEADTLTFAGLHKLKQIGFFGRPTKTERFTRTISGTRRWAMISMTKLQFPPLLMGDVDDFFDNLARIPSGPRGVTYQVITLNWQGTQQSWNLSVEHKRT